MCGRYSISVAPEELAAHFDAALPFGDSLRSRLNAAPSQNLPTLLNEGDRVITMLRWGLIPRWADDPAIGSRMINARAETVAEKPTFREPLKKRRCLALADGFYEWQQTPSGKRPMRISLQSGEPFAFAGLWDTWRDTEGNEMRTFTIITTEPNDLVAPIHNRMPVVLTPENEALWLDNSLPQEAWLAALKPYPADLMRVEPANPATLRNFDA